MAISHSPESDIVSSKPADSWIRPDKDRRQLTSKIQSQLERTKKAVEESAVEEWTKIDSGCIFRVGVELQLGLGLSDRTRGLSTKHARMDRQISTQFRPSPLKFDEVPDASIMCPDP